MTTNLMFPAQRPLTLNQLAIPNALKIVVLAPHPDDFDAIGVTLRHFQQQGAEIHLAVLTRGASGVEDGFAHAYTTEEKGALREKEQVASCHFFGLPEARVCFMSPSLDEKGNPKLDDHNLSLIRALLLAQQPDLVFMPHGNDSNVTHQRTYALFRAVAIAEQLTLWACLNQDAKTITMRTDLYLPFDENDATWKGELLRFHASQQQRNLNARQHGFDERVLAVNRVAASTLGLSDPYAEVFELEHYPISPRTQIG